MNPSILTTLLERATTEPLGLVIETNNPKALRENYLQRLRQSHPRPEVRELTFAIPSTPNTLYICRPGLSLETDLITEESA